MLPSVTGLSFVRVLGQGGFGTVHLARQHRLDRDVAVKLDNRVLSSERDQARFLREARAAARLSGHPNVVNVYDAGVTEDGRPYIVMELCTGGSLADLPGPLPMDQVVEIGTKLADALARMHELGILHRDIKPANILVNAFGAVKLADFGLAAILDAHAESTITVGALSPHYAAPEVFAHAAPSPAGDIYSLAATLYALAAGSLPRAIPWPADSMDHLVGALNRPVPPIPHAPPAVNAALLGALSADAGRRTASAAEFRDQLSGLRTAPPPPRQARRSPVRAIATALAIPALVAAGFYGRGLLPDETVTAQNAPTTTPTAAPEWTDKCFGGIVSTADMEFVARPVPCAESHAWQAFGGVALPPEAKTMTGTQILALPQVSKACSTEVMTERATVDVTGWSVEPLPDADRTGVLCLAGEPGEPTTGSAFRTG